MTAAWSQGTEGRGCLGIDGKHPATGEWGWAPPGLSTWRVSEQGQLRSNLAASCLGREHGAAL